jgi:betaine lipid synthase
MLQLLAAHLKAQPSPIGRGATVGKPKIWVDIGGGTGWNIEKM